MRKRAIVSLLIISFKKCKVCTISFCTIILLKIQNGYLIKIICLFRVYQTTNIKTLNTILHSQNVDTPIREQKIAIYLCTEGALSRVPKTFPSFLETLFHGLAIMRFLLDFLGSRARQWKKVTERRDKRRRREEEKGQNSMWKGANNGARTIYDVSQRNTLISNVSRRSSYISAYRGRPTSCEKTSRREDSVACERECSETDVNGNFCGYMECRRRSRSASSRINSSKIDRVDIAVEQTARFARILRANEISWE